MVQNLTAISDVIELGAGIGISGAGAQQGNNVIYKLDNGRTLQIDGVKLANLTTGTSATCATTIKRNK